VHVNCSFWGWVGASINDPAQDLQPSSTLKSANPALPGLALLLPTDKRQKLYTTVCCISRQIDTLILVRWPDGQEIAYYTVAFTTHLFRIFHIVSSVQLISICRRTFCFIQRSSSTNAQTFTALSYSRPLPCFSLVDWNLTTLLTQFRLYSITSLKILTYELILLIKSEMGLFSRSKII